MPFKNSKNFIQKRKLNDVRVPNALIKNPYWSIGEIQAYVIYYRYSRRKQVTPYRLQQLTGVHHYHNDGDMLDQIFATKTFGKLTIGYWRVIDKILKFIVQSKTDSNLRAKTTIPYEVLWSKELSPTEKRIMMLFLMYMENGLSSVSLKKVMDDLGIKKRADFAFDKVISLVEKYSILIAQNDDRKETLLFFDKIYGYPDGNKINSEKLVNTGNKTSKITFISTKKILYSYNIIENKFLFFKNLKIKNRYIKYFIVDCSRKKFETIVSESKKDNLLVKIRKTFLKKKEEKNAIRSYSLYKAEDLNHIKFILYRSSLKRFVSSAVLPISPRAVKFEVSYRGLNPATFNHLDNAYLDELNHDLWWIVPEYNRLYDLHVEDAYHEAAIKFYGNDSPASIDKIAERNTRDADFWEKEVKSVARYRANLEILKAPVFQNISSGWSIERRDRNYCPEKATDALSRIYNYQYFSKQPVEKQLLSMLKKDKYLLYSRDQKKELIDEVSHLLGKKPSKWLWNWFNTTPIFLIIKAINKVIHRKRKRTAGHLWTKIGKLCCRYVSIIKKKFNLDKLTETLKLDMDEVVRRITQVLHPKRFKEIFGEHLTKYFGFDILSKEKGKTKQQKEYACYDEDYDIRDSLQLV